MSVRKEGKRWRVDVSVIVNGKVARFRPRAISKAEAHEKERELFARHAAGTLTDGKPPLFRDWADVFMIHGVAENKPSERKAKRKILDAHLLPAFGHERIDRIEGEPLTRFIVEQLKAAAPKTVNNRLTVLRRMLTIAHEWRRMPAPPRIKLLTKVPRPGFRFLSFAEATALAEAGDGQWRHMIVFAMRTGLRRGELQGLRWEDIDLERGVVHVQRSVWDKELGLPKGGIARRVPLGADARKALETLGQRAPSAYVFGPGAAFLLAGKTKWPLWRACDRAGLERFGWHVLRHTFASHLAMRAVPLKAIQELLGHSTIEMTMRYAHLSPEILDEAVRRIDGPEKAQNPTGLS